MRHGNWLRCTDYQNPSNCFQHPTFRKYILLVLTLAGLPTLAVDWWAVTFGTAKKVRADCGPAQPHPHCTKCNSPPVNGQCTNGNPQNGGPKF